VEASLSKNDYLVGDNLTIADISFVCEFAQFLREGHYESEIKKKGLDLISKDFKEDYPLCFKHLFTLSAKEEFASVMGTYLDWYKEKHL
jgi:glutathione S-transferase